MPTMTITPSFVNPPGEGKKMGSVKLPDNSILLALPGVLAQIKPRSTYEVEYTEPTATFNYRTIKAVKLVAGAAQTAGNSGGGFVKDKETQLQIFVCGGFNNAVSSGQISVLDEQNCLLAVETLKRVWRQAFGEAAAKKEAKAGEYEDEIPF